MTTTKQPTRRETANPNPVLRQARPRHAAALLLASTLVALFVQPVWADGSGGSVYTSTFSSVAVGGYDPVAFFTDGKPTKGSKKFEWEHRDATWRFASAANLATFKQNPAKYSPQYGGYCAWAMASGDKAPGKPNHWKIVDDKLYLNYSSSVQDKWLADVPGFIAKADAQWPKLNGKD